MCFKSYLYVHSVLFCVVLSWIIMTFASLSISAQPTKLIGRTTIIISCSCPQKRLQFTSLSSEQPPSGLTGCKLAPDGRLPASSWLVSQHVVFRINSIKILWH